MALRISVELSLPRDTVTSTLVVYGGKGMGKTNFGAVLVEELSAAGLRWAVLDPMGVWWGMRHSKDGKGNGVECLILGGAHGDIPIEPTGGAVIADLVADERVNVIVDISRKSNGEMWSIGERIRFANDYGKRLFQRQGSLVDGQRREPILQILDEAARYIPQMIRAGQPELAMCMSTWATMVEEGRNIGLGVALLTQRSARLNKDVAELADLMLAFRTVGPNSIDAVIDWLGEHVPKDNIKKMTEIVRSLPVGSCLAVSPGWLNFEKVIHIRERKTFDSSATPKAGEKASRITGKGAKPDLDKYATRMRETIERVSADDPKTLRREIADLKKQLAERGKGYGEQLALHTQKVEGENSTLRKSNADLVAEINKRNTELSRINVCASHVIKEAEAILLFSSASNGKQRPATLASVAPKTEFKVRTPGGSFNDPNVHVSVERVMPRQEKKVESNGDALKGPEQRILNAIAWLQGIGVDQPEQSAVAFLAGYVVDGGAFKNPRGALSQKGLVKYHPGGKISLTEEGNKYAEIPDIPQTNEALQEAVLNRLPRPEAKLLRSLIASYPNALSNQELADSTGYEVMGGAYKNPRGRLSSLGIVEYPQPGMVRARDLLFPL